MNVATEGNYGTYGEQLTDEQKAIYRVLQEKYLGADGSYEYRKKIAAVNGIIDYKGTTYQNELMLNLLRAGILIKP